MSQCGPLSESETLVFPETLKSLESLFINTPETASAQPPTPKRHVKHPEDDCTYTLVLSQNLLMEMEEIKQFTKSTEQKFEEKHF